MFWGRVQDCWLPTPLACFPFTSPTVRHRVPSGFNWALLTAWQTCSRSYARDHSRYIRYAFMYIGEASIPDTVVFFSLCTKSIEPGLCHPLDVDNLGVVPILKQSCRSPATKALHTICGNNISIVSSSWWWAYNCPKHVEQITSAIKPSVASTWFSSLRLQVDEVASTVCPLF